MVVMDFKLSVTSALLRMDRGGTVANLIMHWRAVPGRLEASSASLSACRKHSSTVAGSLFDLGALFGLCFLPAWIMSISVVLLVYRGSQTSAVRGADNRWCPGTASQTTLAEPKCPGTTC